MVTSITTELLRKISERYPLVEKELGERKRVKVKGMTFEIRAFEAEGLGNVSVMAGSAMLGLMKMDTLVVNPFDRDMALFSYDRIYAMGNDTLLLEMYDTRISKPEITAMNPILEKYAAYPDGEAVSQWYDDIKISCVKKKSKKVDSNAFDAFTNEYLETYLNLCDDASPVDTATKKKAAQVYTEGLLKNGGPSTDQFVAAKGREYTEKLFREVIFGTGTPNT